MLAFGGILFFLALGCLVAIAAWLLVGYVRAGAKAAEDGIDPSTDHHEDAGHVSGPRR
jgi:hypothetical protein